ncbi:hypothetical protein KC19_9G175600 [Ceratodon purpureus]|uniref:Myb-like domain-containing protein n=1 Tax=Ceratodon purpureus TaxID=3225 RepID=A0A8T0GXK9_CERPU|nr:hypothetical protein KC19_9G175600 [Ceratodon purpureus]
MAGSGEQVPLWPPSGCYNDSYSLMSILNYLPGSQVTQTESNSLENGMGTDGCFGQLRLEAPNPPVTPRRLGILPGSEVNEDPLSQRQETNSGVEEKMPEPSKGKGRRKRAHAGDKAAEDKRTRVPNWVEEEKTLLLAGKREYFQLCILQATGVISTFDKFDKSWSHYVANRSVDRCQPTCQGQWDTLCKDFNAIYDHEEKNQLLDPSRHHGSFWTMTKEQKDIANHERRSAFPKPLRELPREFQRAWYTLIESIYQKQDELSKLRVAKKMKIQSSILVDPNLPTSSTAPVVTSTHKDSASDISAGIPGSQRAEDKLVLGMDVKELISSVVAPFVTKQIANTIEPLISVMNMLVDDKKDRKEDLQLALQGKFQILKHQLNIQFNGYPDLGNVDESAGPGAGVTLNCERSLSQDAQLNVANSYNPSGRDLFLNQSDANGAGLWQSMNFHPEAETMVYDPLTDSYVWQTDSAHAGQLAVNQIQAPNEDLSTFTQYPTQLNSRQNADQCQNTNS